MSTTDTPPNTKEAPTVEQHQEKQQPQEEDDDKKNTSSSIEMPVIEQQNKDDDSAAAATSAASPSSASLPTAEEQGRSNSKAPSSPTSPSFPGSPKCDPDTGLATVFETSVNMVTNLIGGGVLALSSAFAMTSPILGVLSFLGVTCITVCNLVFIAESSEHASEFDYAKLTKLALGSYFAPVAVLCLTLFPFGALCAYHAIIAHVGPPMAERFLGAQPGDTLHNPVDWMAFASVIFFLVGSRRHLAELFWSSVAGFLTIAFVVLCIVIRFFDGSYAPGGQFRQSNASAAAALAAANDRPSLYLTPSFFAAIPLFLFSLSVHNNFGQYVKMMAVDRAAVSAAVAASLAGRETVVDEDARIRMEQRLYDSERKRLAFLATKYSHGVLIVVYLIAALFGYYTFGEHQLLMHSNGDILVSYSDEDTLLTVARLFLFIHILTCYPLFANASRRFLFALVYGDKDIEDISDTTLYLTTLGLVGGSLLVAYAVPSIDVVLGINGALCGSAIILVIPSLNFLILVKGEKGDFAAGLKRAVAAFSILFAVVVGGISLVTIFQHKAAHMEKHDAAAAAATTAAAAAAAAAGGAEVTVVRP